MLRIDEHIPFAWNDDGGTSRRAALELAAQSSPSLTLGGVRFGIPAHRQRVNDAARIIHIVRHLNPDQVAIPGQINGASLACSTILALGLTRKPDYIVAARQ